MESKNKKTQTYNVLSAITLSIITVVAVITLFLSTVDAIPIGPIIDNYTTESSSITTDAKSITTPRTTVTTMLLDLSTAQSQKWKAYVGNVSGSLILADADNYSVYQWNLVAYTGEVYASRQNTITWADINCSTVQNLTQDDSDLSLSVTDTDSVTNTFNSSTVHTAMTVGTRTLGGCYAIRTNNLTGQQSESADAQFQEIALSDGASNVYAAHLEEDIMGFDNNSYDFQIIVPEATSGASSAYYFYLELD